MLVLVERPLALEPDFFLACASGAAPRQQTNNRATKSDVRRAEVGMAGKAFLERGWLSGLGGGALPCCQGWGRCVLGLSLLAGLPCAVLCCVVLCWHRVCGFKVHIE